ncbi:hypothetical protein N431DRAFT_407513 [Stipitochalara longipes BDJ]|nr:hypothetical protein N431DRAFT_407513 [Stipitochalara longipes BDJ]
MAGIDDPGIPLAVFATDLMNQRAATFHEALDVESRSNTAISEPQSKEISDLEETLKRYQRQAPDQVDFDFDLLRCTWDDVLHELERAQAAVSERDNRGENFYRKAWRALGTVETVLAPRLTTIPDNLNVLQGGLVAIFRLARHRSQNRQKILRVFEDIPNVIMMAYGKAGTIPQDRPGSLQLHRMIGELQQTLLRTIPDLIDRLNPVNFMGKAMHPFKDFNIDDLLAEVRCSSERVRACVEEVIDDMIVSTHQTVVGNNMVSKDIYVIAQQTEEEVGQLREKIEEILKQQKSFQAALDAASGKNGLLSFLMEYVKPEQSGEYKTPKESPPVYEPSTPVTPKQLLGLMNVHHLRALDDEQHIIRRCQSLDSEAISHAATIFQTTQVQKLLQAPESGVVLVNGYTDRSQNTKITPITYVCATLTCALRRSASANVVLAFFCGQHSSSQDDLLGPQGLLRSLVADIVLSLAQNECILEAAPIWFPASQRDFEELSFKDICQLFFHLVELVPKEIPVYCVVDGISFYEREGWREDYDIMMECFGSLIANNAVATAFKLLLTSPTVSRWLSDLMPSHQKISLRNKRTRRTVPPEILFESAFVSHMEKDTEGSDSCKNETDSTKDWQPLTTELLNMNGTKVDDTRYAMQPLLRS